MAGKAKKLAIVPEGHPETHRLVDEGWKIYWVKVTDEEAPVANLEIKTGYPNLHPSINIVFAAKKGKTSGRRPINRYDPTWPKEVTPLTDPDWGLSRRMVATVLQLEGEYDGIYINLPDEIKE